MYCWAFMVHLLSLLYDVLNVVRCATFWSLRAAPILALYDNNLIMDMEKLQGWIVNLPSCCPRTPQSRKSAVLSKNLTIPHGRCTSDFVASKVICTYIQLPYQVP